VTYVPGACNIGPEEQARRALIGWLGAVGAVLVLGVLLAADAPPWLRIATLPFTALAAAGWLQVRRRFCAGFAWAGVVNFGDRSQLCRIEDPVGRAADRAAALGLARDAFLIGVAVTLPTLLI